MNWRTTSLCKAGLVVTAAMAMGVIGHASRAVDRERVVEQWERSSVPHVADQELAPPGAVWIGEEVINGVVYCVYMTSMGIYKEPCDG